MSPEAYTAERSAAVYRRMMDDACMVLDAGHSVIVDAVFARPGERDEVDAIAKEAGVPVTGIWLEAPREELLARVDARKGDASDADSAVVERQLDYELGELAGWHRVSSAGSPADVLERALRLL